MPLFTTTCFLCKCVQMCTAMCSSAQCWLWAQNCSVLGKQPPRVWIWPVYSGLEGARGVKRAASKLSRKEFVKSQKITVLLNTEVISGRDRDSLFLWEKVPVFPCFIWAIVGEPGFVVMGDCLLSWCLWIFPCCLLVDWITFHLAPASLGEKFRFICKCSLVGT